MSNSKNTKSASGAQTPATHAAGKLASFSASKPSTSAIPGEAAAGLAVGQLSAEFAKQRTSLWDDVSLFMREVIKPLQDSLDSLQSTVNSFQSRLTFVELVAGNNFERLTAVVSIVKALQKQNQLLLDRLEVLMQMMGPNVFPKPPNLERAHRTPSPRFGQRTSPRTFLVCFSRFQQKDAALLWARNHDLQYQLAALRIYQDISTTLAKKRASFNGVKQALYHKNAGFHMLYLALLRVTHRNEVKRKSFLTGSSVSISSSATESW